MKMTVFFFFFFFFVVVFFFFFFESTDSPSSHFELVVFSDICYLTYYIYLNYF